MPPPSPILFLAVLSGLVWPGVCAEPPAGGGPASSVPMGYEEWVKRYADTPAWPRNRVDIFKRQAPPWVMIFTVENDSRRHFDSWQRSEPRPYFCGTEVSADGVLHSFRIGERGIQGGEDKPSAELLAQVAAIVPTLPADQGVISSPGRVVVVRFEQEGAVRHWVYDRANLPKAALELLRVIKPDIDLWTASLGPMTQISCDDHPSWGLLALTPDRRQLITATQGAPLIFWNSSTLAKERVVAVPKVAPTGLLFSPDGALALLIDTSNCNILDAKTWQPLKKLMEPSVDRQFYPSLSHPQFTADGKALLLRRSKSSLRCFDTATWEPRELPPGIPSETAAWEPASHDPRAIVSTVDDRLLLWDTAASRPVALLDEPCRLESVAFSPDGTHVAVGTLHPIGSGYWGKCRLRIWRSRDGQKLQELIPYPNDRAKRIPRIFWTPDGRYVIVLIEGSRYSSTTIKIWNAATGRHRGSLYGDCGRMFEGELFAEGTRLAAFGSSGTLCVWDLAEALRRVRELETSLGEP